MSSRVIGVAASNVSEAEMLRMRLISAAHQDGVSPTQFLELLDAALKSEAWLKLDIGFPELIAATPPVGMGLPVEDFNTLLHLKHRYEDSDQSVKKRMTQVREKARGLLGESLKLNKHGVNQFSGGDQITSTTPRGTSREYVIGRLNRDAEAEGREDLSELARLLSTQQITVREAKRRAGYGHEQKTKIFYPEDLKRTARALNKHFDPDELCREMKRGE